MKKEVRVQTQLGGLPRKSAITHISSALMLKMDRAKRFAKYMRCENALVLHLRAKHPRADLDESKVRMST